MGTAARLALKDGVQIPLVGLGVYLTKPNGETYDAVRAALKCGYRHIDTAALYGNEKDVGRAIRDSGIAREQIFVTTKLWVKAYEPKSAATTEGEAKQHPAYEFAMARAKESLANLNTYIDLYLLHSPHHPSGRLHMWRALEDLKSSEQVKSIGVSNYGIPHLRELFAACRIRPTVNQIEVHPFLQRRELTEFCKANGVVVEAYSPLAKAKKMQDPVLLEIAAKHNKSPAQVLVRWSLQKGYVVLPKSVDPKRIQENADVFGFALSSEDMEAMERLDEDLVTGWDPTTLD